MEQAKPTRYQRSIARRQEEAESMRRLADSPTTSRLESIFYRFEAWRVEPREGEAVLADELADKRAGLRAEHQARMHDLVLDGREKLRIALGDTATNSEQSPHTQDH